MFSLKYKMQRVGRYGNLETSTTTLKVSTELLANSLLESEVANGWTMLEVSLV